MWLAVNREGHHGGQAGRHDDLGCKHGLRAVRVGFGDNELDAGLDGPGHLLLEHRAHLADALGVLGIEGIAVADIAGKKRAALLGDVARNRQGLAVQRLKHRFLADHAQLVAMRVIGESLDHVRAGVNEVSMQPLDDLGMLEHDLGHKWAGLQITAPFELEEIALGAEDRTLVKSLYQPKPGHARLPAASTL